MILNRDLKDKLESISSRVYWLQNHNENNLEYNPPVMVSGCRFIAYRFKNDKGQLAIATVSTGSETFHSAMNIVKPLEIVFFLDFVDDEEINYSRDFSQDSIYQSIYRLTILEIKELNSILVRFKLQNKQALEYAQDFLGRSYTPLYQLTEFLGKTLDKVKLLEYYNEQLKDLDCTLTLNDFKRYETSLSITT